MTLKLKKSTSLHKKCPYSEFFWSVFSPNAEKYWPETLRIGALFTQCFARCSSCQPTVIQLRSSHRKCSVRQGVLEISQNSQENTCARVFFLITLQAQACKFIKIETLAQVFFCEFAEFLRTSFLKNSSGCLLLKINNNFFVTIILQNI